MFYCAINIDFLDDDYILCFILGFNNKFVRENFINRINSGEYMSEFAKNCVFASVCETEDIVKIFDNEQDAIQYVESFFKDYIQNNCRVWDDSFRTLENKYKAFLKDIPFNEDF